MQNSVVIFSPFCSSFDQFKNFEERGESFKKIVNLL
jgi:UDP-N-acetylmuramoylalanine--D-glutamate ligase